mgnify:FL=1
MDKREPSFKAKAIRIQILILVVFFVLYIVSSVVYYRSYTEKIIDLNTRMVTQSAQAIRENNANIMNTVISFVSNATVQGYLSETDVYEKSIALRSLSNLLFNYRYLHPTLQAVAVLEPSGDSVREGNILYSDFQAILENTRHKTFSSLVMSSAGNPLIAVRYPSNSHTDFGRQIGECIFVFNVSYMLSGIQSISLEAESDFYIVDDQNITLYATHPNAIAEPLAESYASMLRESFEPTVEKKGGRIIVSQRINDLNWHIVSVTSTSVLLRDQQNLHLLFLAMAAMAIVVLIATSFWFYSHTSRVLLDFIAGIRRIDEGRSEYVTCPDNTREFQSLTDSFNRMLRNLYRLRQEAMDNQRKMFLRELENKQTQILFLQTQINPHFLYNTLECINSAGAVYGSWEIQQMAVSLGEIMRYSIKGSNIVTLAREIDIVISYLSIQKVRFPDKVSLVLDIPDPLLEVRLIKLMLQPIVENCVIHGLEPTTRKCLIRISARQAGSVMTIRVSDSGKGITAEKLADIRRAIADSNSNFFNETNSIGLANISRRIKLFYGDAYGLTISSDDRGTVVEVTFPMEIDDNVQSDSY